MGGRKNFQTVVETKKGVEWGLVWVITLLSVEL